MLPAADSWSKHQCFCELCDPESVEASSSKNLQFLFYGQFLPVIAEELLCFFQKTAWMLLIRSAMIFCSGKLARSAFRAFSKWVNKFLTTGQLTFEYRTGVFSNRD